MIITFCGCREIYDKEKGKDWLESVTFFVKIDFQTGKSSFCQLGSLFNLMFDYSMDHTIA